jgi:hypothetical protein
MRAKLGVTSAWGDSEWWQLLTNIDMDLHTNIDAQKLRVARVHPTDENPEGVEAQALMRKTRLALLKHHTK